MKTTIFEQSVDLGAVGIFFGSILNKTVVLSTAPHKIKRVKQVINVSSSSGSVWEDPVISTAFNFGQPRPFVNPVESSGMGFVTGLTMGVDSLKEINVDLQLSGGQAFTIASLYHCVVPSFVDDITITQYVIIEWEEL